MCGLTSVIVQRTRDVSRRRDAWHRAVLVLALGSAWSLAACYSYVPLTPDANPNVGEPIALEVSDTGRVQLADRFGPGLLRVEGRLTSEPTREYVLKVDRVYRLFGPAAQWNGEAARIEREYVRSVQVRKLSKGRTVFTAGAITVGLVAAFIGADLIGFSQGGGRGPSGPSGPAANRVGR